MGRLPRSVDRIFHIADIWKIDFRALRPSDPLHDDLLVPMTHGPRCPREGRNVPEDDVVRVRPMSLRRWLPSSDKRARTRRSSLLRCQCRSSTAARLSAIKRTAPPNVIRRDGTVRWTGTRCVPDMAGVRAGGLEPSGTAPVIGAVLGR